MLFFDLLVHYLNLLSVKLEMTINLGWVGPLDFIIPLCFPSRHYISGVGRNNKITQPEEFFDNGSSTNFRCFITSCCRETKHLVLRLVPSHESDSS